MSGCNARERGHEIGVFAHLPPSKKTMITLIQALFLPRLLFILLMLPPASQLQPRVSPESPYHSTESGALLELKRAISDPADSLASWAEETARAGPCRWRGVTCDPDGTHVIALDLAGLGLGLRRPGKLAPLAWLTELTSLNLSFNRFDSSPIPPELGRRLTYLNLSNAGFSGKVPPAIGRMSAIVSLDLSSSIFLTVGRLEIADAGFFGDLPELEELYLDGVILSSSSLGGKNCRPLSSFAPKLRVVSLAGCSMNCPLDTLLYNLARLNFLRVDSNDFSSPVPAFLANFSSLTVLGFSSCGLIGEFPAGIFQLRNLRILDVTHNWNLSGRLPDFVEKSYAIEELLLAETNFSGELPASIGNLASLTRLQLTGAKFSGELPVGIGELVRLVYLDVSLNNFTGKVPSLAQLRQLVRLDLSSNKFTGPIPDIADGLTSLVEFNLRANSFSGSVPMSLFALTSLQTLQLDENQLNGGIHEFANPNNSSLTTVDLSDNNFQGAFPKSIYKLSKLKVLVLSSNNFSGVVNLDMFENEKNLSRLELSNSGLSVQVRNGNLSNFPQIGTLKLGSCNLNKIPEFLLNQQRLYDLDLSNNVIPGNIPNWIWNIKTLSYLNLSYNKLEGLEQPLENLSSSPLLLIDLHSNFLQGPIPPVPLSSIIVDYSDNRFFSTIPPAIGDNLHYSVFFSLSRNNLAGSIPSSICNATNLLALDLSGNSLSGLIPPCLIHDVSSLNVLNLRENSISGSMPDFSVECSLRTLDLNGNKLVGHIPTSLKNCKQLKVLNLGNNAFEGTFPSWLGKMPSLRVLVLRSNHFHGKVEAYCGFYFKMLQIIDLSSNNFSGNLDASCIYTWKSMIVGENAPILYHQVIQSRLLDLTPLYYRDTVTVTLKGFDVELVKILTVFTFVDLSNNKFDGVIPEAIGNLSMLVVLNLSHNALTGAIPRSIGKLSQLESLDLSQNMLTDEIPAELAQLNFLAVLNLSSNRLMGKIPQGQQLSTIPNSSYLHNVELCGAPLTRSCESGRPQKRASTQLESTKVFDWKFIIVGLGFGGGMALSLIPLVLWKKGQKWFNKCVDGVFVMIFPPIHFVFLDCDKVRIEAEERVDEEFMRTAFEEGSFSRRFCVFCTKLDSIGAGVVHRECSCEFFSSTSHRRQ